jgi:hypothetical protein
MNKGEQGRRKYLYLCSRRSGRTRAAGENPFMALVLVWELKVEVEGEVWR